VITPFKVVFVCTGNRFRSPLAAAVLAAEVSSLPVEIDSLGTLDTVTMAPLEIAVAHAERFDFDLTDHRSRSLAGEDLSNTDLVIGFERRHVVSAVVDANAPFEVSFTLPELVELLDDIDPEETEALAHARSAARLASGLRPDRAHWQPAEITDPIGEPADRQRAIALRVHELTSRLAVRLFGDRGSG